MDIQGNPQVSTGNGTRPPESYGPHTEKDRIDHCGRCEAENTPQVEDLCPECGTTGCLVSTWGEFQHQRYRNGKRYEDNGPQEWEDGPQPPAPAAARN